jgi:regulator of nucleoside diphosphate kinase
MEVPSRRIFITDYDLDRLKMLIRSQGDLKRPDKLQLHNLAADLRHAVVISAQKIIPNVITMNSRFHLKDLDTAEEGEYTLVFPGKTNKGYGKISILAPIGAALIGAQESETISVMAPSGIKRLRVESISYQPEAAGEYHL